jgi:hypothetical protein
LQSPRLVLVMMPFIRQPFKNGTATWMDTLQPMPVESGSACTQRQQQ